MISDMGFAGSIFVESEKIIDDLGFWHQMHCRGHEIGYGGLISMTPDGSLPNWTQAGLEQEVRSFRSLLESTHIPAPASVYLPGSECKNSEGNYLDWLMRSFTVGISPAASGCFALTKALNFDFQPIDVRIDQRIAGLKAGDLPLVVGIKVQQEGWYKMLTIACHEALKRSASLRIALVKHLAELQNDD